MKIRIILAIGLLALTSLNADHLSTWHKTHDRVFLGGDYWANPMEDWRVSDGAAECITAGGNRNIHLITHQLENPRRPFEMSVRIESVEFARKDTGAGFRVGVRSELNEHRSNCFAKGGINAGLIAGQLVLGKARKPIDGHPAAFTLTLIGKPTDGNYELHLIAADAKSGEDLGHVQVDVAPEAILGNVALVNNFETNTRKPSGSRYRFRDWHVTGAAFIARPERRFGPLLWSMYSLSDSRTKERFVLKLSALTGPLGARGNQTVELRVKRGREWELLSTARLDPDAWTATFRVANWDATKAAAFRLVYREQHRDRSSTEHHWSGIIRPNPVDRPLRLGALTCQNDYGFPYEPVALNLLRLNPDLLYFSGDQIYESHGGYGVIREPADRAILNYLRKYYQHGWAFREAMRDRPTLCIPDDHDVFQGNIWGEGGAKMNLETKGNSKGGYREPARMVNVVHKTNAGHHPDPYDRQPSKQDISVYYGDMVYGGIGFAILGDRQWKSGPERVTVGLKRADHVTDPKFDTSKLDEPGLVLLGERQEKFLAEWAQDWRGHSMKVLLSQTVFAGVATHHGRFDGYLKADLDSGGWPQTPRNRTVRILRDSMALHVNGDQHLTSLTQYGADQQRDSLWSFCTPAISAGYQRWWRPDELGMPHRNRPKHGLPHTGEYLDGFGNMIYVYAVGNPIVSQAKNRYQKAHEKGSGFGFVTIDPRQRTYHLDSFRFLVNATDGKPDNQFPGWPVTIHQRENRGENRLR